MTRYPERKGTTLSDGRDPGVVAKIVNAAWSVTRDRLEREARDWSSLYLEGDGLDEALDARLERIEAAICALATKLAEVEATAGYAVERAEAA